MPLVAAQLRAVPLSLSVRSSSYANLSYRHDDLSGVRPMNRPAPCRRAAPQAVDVAKVSQSRFAYDLAWNMHLSQCRRSWM